MSDLADIKADDWVAHYGFCLPFGLYLTKQQVTRTTKFWIFIGNDKYKRENGEIQVKIDRHNRYDFKPSIKPLTEDIEQCIAEQNANIEKKILIDQIKSITDFDQVPTETLRQIAKLLGVGE